MLKHHTRFLSTLALGLAAAALVPADSLAQRALLGVDLYCAAYLVLTAHLAARITSEGLRAHSTEDDEGVVVILFAGVAVVAISLGLVFGVIRSDSRHLVEVGMAAAGIPLSWAMLQTLFAFHYARLHFAEDDRQQETGGGTPKGAAKDAAKDAGARDGPLRGGIRFEATPDPGLWEFLYFSFTVGMTAQVSDTVVTSVRVRRMVLLHGVLSFFYNTVILALAVNVAASMAQ
jgi:uncharacterized membrane protein